MRETRTPVVAISLSGSRRSFSLTAEEGVAESAAGTKVPLGQVPRGGCPLAPVICALNPISGGCPHMEHPHYPSTFQDYQIQV